MLTAKKNTWLISLTCPSWRRQSWQSAQQEDEAVLHRWAETQHRMIVLPASLSSVAESSAIAASAQGSDQLVEPATGKQT